MYVFFSVCQKIVDMLNHLALVNNLKEPGSIKKNIPELEDRRLLFPKSRSRIPLYSNSFG